MFVFVQFCIAFDVIVVMMLPGLFFAGVVKNGAFFVVLHIYVVCVCFV